MISRLSVKWKMERIYLYDMSWLKTDNGTVVQPLKDIGYFKKVWLDLGALTWPTGFSIHGNTVARDGKLIKKTA